MLLPTTPQSRSKLRPPHHPSVGFLSSLSKGLEDLEEDRKWGTGSLPLVGVGGAATAAHPCGQPRRSVILS